MFVLNEQTGKQVLPYQRHKVFRDVFLLPPRDQKDHLTQL